MVDSTVMQSGRYKAYPEYKDSGVEWLGDIPSGWGVVRVKNQFKVYNGATPRSGVEEYWGGDIVWVTPSDLSQLSSNTISESSRTITRQGLSSCGTTLVPKDSLILSCRAPIGSLAITKTELCTNQGCKALVPISDIPVELYYYYFSSINAELNVLGSGSTFLELSTDELVNIALPLPTYSESKLICNFLDYETAKIDTLIEKQQRLIELLTEKRQAVISHAVTKGLNPDVPMKDSGVEWLGEVPEHWEVKRFKTIFKIRKRIAGELGHDVLSITQKGIKIKDTESGEGQLSMDYSKYQLVYKGDYAMNHMDLLTGFVDISKYDGVTSPDYRVFTLEEKNSLPEYFLAFLQMGYINKLFFPFGQGAAHMGRWRLPTEAFREFLAPVPPKNEQKAIADFIFNSLEQMDILEKKSRKAIKLMQERRTALISAAVTGKIDVRDWVKPE